MELKVVVVQRLATTDDLEEWPKIAKVLEHKERQIAFETARPIWLRRLVQTGKMHFHPNVLKQLQENEWKV